MLPTICIILNFRAIPLNVRKIKNEQLACLNYYASRARAMRFELLIGLDGILG